MEKIAFAVVVGLVSFKNGVFVHGAPIDPKIEPWFLIRCHFIQQHSHSRLYYTKGAQWGWTCPLWPLLAHQFEQENHTVVKEAIERYVTLRVDNYS